VGRSVAAWRGTEFGITHIVSRSRESEPGGSNARKPSDEWWRRAGDFADDCGFRMDPVYAYFDADEQTYLKYGKQARSGKERHERRKTMARLSGTGRREGFSRTRGVVNFIDNQVNPTTAPFAHAESLPTRISR